ncbi:ATP-binding cassette domain-containing protein [Halosolutus gelatinilyticus]|uniref:ATP-binding cassette domain-containing protein n=1 Tax=Halosolutus gelatinilyticus TaxID=2931975 RepID=UPI001FF565DA|nr:excinuclease ABC subunit UvrA [Halosolutus gelatinilyticus]
MIDTLQSDRIELTRVRENNLKDISLEIPKRQITVFTGVSGAGKSSLVFDTIAAESQRQLNEMFSTFVQNFLPRYGQPDADSIENLSAAVIVNQKPISGNARSTVGTFTDIYSLLRLLYSRVGEPQVGYSDAFSFNVPEGMCPTCDGLGETMTLDVEQLLDTSASLDDGAIRFPPFKHQWKTYVEAGLFDGDKTLAEYTESEWELLLHGDTSVDHPNDSIELNYEGLVDKFTRLYIERDISSLGERTRESVDRVTSRGTCPACEGARLNRDALRSEIDGYNIAELAAMNVTDLLEVVPGIDEPAAEPIVSELVDRLENLVTVGLGYLSLDRETPTLSGGEAQRIKMVKHLNSSLTDMTYIFDEPTIGLHPRDVHGLNELLRELRDAGNTVLVVEHDPDVIEIADHVIDIGPEAGENGGEIVYQGGVDGLYEADTLTGRHLSRDRPVKSEFRRPTGRLIVADASRHNLRNVTVDIPTGVLTVVTGVAGAGKSTLTDVFLEAHPDAISIDQSAVSTSIRSVLATYTGLMDDIRDQFAQANGVSTSLFSFNSDGACPECEGHGFNYTDLAFMDPVKSPCEVCDGRRYRDDVLRYTVRGKSISDVLDMTVSEALDFFERSSLRRTLEALEDVGVGYLTLGQSLPTLSGGECQRIKLSSELHKSGSVYVLDEPTTGLHMADLERMLSILNRLVDEGNTVVVIEHNLEIVKNADWVIDVGPDGGRRGGTVVFEGTPRQLLDEEGSFTAEFLRKDVRAA